MPWCDDCARYWNPPSLTPEGECPTCHRKLADPATISRPSNVPWHFKLLLGGITVYLGYRAWQGIDWLVRRVG